MRKGRERRRERSGDKAPEVRVAKASEARSPVDAKSGKIPETRIPKSPETRIVRSADGKFAAKTPEGRGLRSTDGKFAKTPEGRGSRSLSAESSRSSDSKTSPVSESRRRRPSAPERTRQLSGASVATKSPEVIPEVPAAGPPIDADSKERKVGDKEPVMETNSTSKKSEEVVVSKDINKETNNVPEAKSLTNDVIIKQELPDALPGPKEPLQEVKTLESTNQIKEEVATTTNVSAAAVGITGKVHQTKSEVKVEKDREGKSRSDRAKVKHKKKHKRKHDKGKEERSRDRHKAERRRKPLEKSKTSDVEGKEKSSMDVGQWISYGEFSPKNLYYRMGS